jgi:predicted NAD/FAD-binding protein
MRIAIVGTGIAGMGAAWALHRHHDIVLYEKEERIGGHSHTVDVDYDGTRIAVDTGFIVYNELNYPNLTALFHHLGVETQASAMTFGFSARDGGLEWQGNTVRSLFAQRRNMLRPSFHRMWLDILRFRREAIADLTGGRIAELSLAQYLESRGYGESFRDDCLLPMGAAIWSTSARDMLDFPAASFIRFFDNHRLFHFDKPLWRTVKGGSRRYVDRLTEAFADRIRLNTTVSAIERNSHGVTIIDETGATARFDQVILACHSDQALRLLANPNDAERDILGALRYAPNAVYLHRDPALMPRRASVWSSWNYLSKPGGDGNAVSVTYWMNSLQGIDKRCPLFVSLNPLRPPRSELTFATFQCDHPQFDAAALVAQRRLHLIQGLKHTWYCGAYAGYGFHEDGLTSGLEIARRLGALLPWGEVAGPRVFSTLREAAE